MAVARIRRPFGVRGELVLDILPGAPGSWADSGRLYLGGARRAVEVESLRRHGRDAVLRLKGVRDRNQAEGLRGEVIHLRLEDLPPLPEGEYYLHQLEGLEVFTEQGEPLGRVKEILKTGANDVYVVQGGAREILLPAIPQVIREVRLEEGKMVVRLMEGLV
ncbi:MAG: 16S rRNA processing protein RimM [Anaerolineales bacterium]|nr:16S rRNA processing protein RimM [Anaerolineales bacterium]